MKATVALRSEMPGGNGYIGWWGAMGGPKQKGITQYVLSPYRQKPLKDMFSGYIFHGIRRIAGQAPYFVPPFAIAYAVYRWGNAQDHFNNSKAGHIAALKAAGEEHHDH